MHLVSSFKSSTKGFTLVELIIVIVILAILATISFLSFSSQSSAARDSKRATDIAGIASKINVVQIQGVNILSMAMDESKSLTGGYLAGHDLSVPIGTKYKAGLINYGLLGLNYADFSDPDGAMYPIGVTTLAGIQLEIAARTENDIGGNLIGSGVIINGTYVPRKIEPKLVNNTSSGVLIVVDNEIGYFKIGDLVTLGTKDCEINRISSDKTKLTLVNVGTTAKCDVINNISAKLSGTQTLETISLIKGKIPGPILAGSNPPY